MRTAVLTCGLMIANKIESLSTTEIIIASAVGIIAVIGDLYQTDDSLSSWLQRNKDVE